jgi:hypothetical protein
MTPQERADYRANMRSLKIEEERQALRLEHHKLMQERARQMGVTLPEMPPTPGGGMGPGGMTGPGGGGMMGPGGGGMMGGRWPRPLIGLARGGDRCGRGPPALPAAVLSPTISHPAQHDGRFAVRPALATSGSGRPPPA